ncbi:MAG: hypothetical protein Q7O66_01030, partial [Dehalococcoidia bacterium]|nr:hypothetical protein [Dehalococcoidia bacterium]
NSFASVARTLGGVADVLELDRSTQMAETAMLNLRLAEGMGDESFHRRFGFDPRAVFGREIEELSSLGLVDCSGAAITLTPRGRLLGNEVFGRLLTAGR